MRKTGSGAGQSDDRFPTWPRLSVEGGAFVGREPAPGAMLGGGSHCHNWQMRYLPLLLLLIAFPAPAETVHEGKVVKVVDGDTLTILVDNLQHKIRLSDIDTPERKQPFG